MERMCPSCEKMVPVTAAVCKYCACNFSRRSSASSSKSDHATWQLKNPLGKWWVLPAGAIGLIVVSNMSFNPPSVVPATAPAPTPVTVAQLESAFDANEVGAMQTYGKRPLAITGTVQKVLLDSDDEPLISFESDGLVPFQVGLGMDATDAAAAIVKGSELTVYCQDLTEMMGQPFGDDCTL